MFELKRNIPIVIMNFTGIYKEENFSKKERILWLDCNRLAGTHGYCDLEAMSNLRHRMAMLPVKGIHFIDSGSYHYVSLIWMEKIKENFNLVVFDHHSDMQKPMFEELLSCGSWITEALETNPYLKSVTLIGLPKDKEELIDPKYKDRIHCFSEEDIRQHDFWSKLERAQGEYPLYISIDKDVMDGKVVETTWDQGNMKLSELKNTLHVLLSNHTILGLDICGECEPVVNNISEIEDNDRFNETLVEFVKKEYNKNQ